MCPLTYLLVIGFGVYMNYLERDEDERIEEAYGSGTSGFANSKPHGTPRTCSG